MDINKELIAIQNRNEIQETLMLYTVAVDTRNWELLKNIFVKDAIHTRNELEKDKKLASKYVERIDNLDDILDEVSSIRKDKINFDRTLEALKNINIQQNKLDSENILIKSNKENLLQKISITENKISEYYEKESDIKYNETIEVKVDDIQNALLGLGYSLKDSVTVIRELPDEISVNDGIRQALKMLSKNL